MHKQGERNMHIKNFSLFLYKLSKSFSPFCKNINSMYAYKLYKLKIIPPLFVNHQQRGEKQINNKDIYAIYIHEGEDAKLASLHTCITRRRDNKILTNAKHNIQCISGDVKLPLHTCIT